MAEKGLEVLADDVFAARARFWGSRFQSVQTAKSGPPLHGSKIGMTGWDVADVDCRAADVPHGKRSRSAG